MAKSNSITLTMDEFLALKSKADAAARLTAKADAPPVRVSSDEYGPGLSFPGRNGSSAKIAGAFFLTPSKADRIINNLDEVRALAALAKLTASERKTAVWMK